jgi:hypothetical protein
LNYSKIKIDQGTRKERKGNKKEMLFSLGEKVHRKEVK